MADVNLIISSLDFIAKAPYIGAPSSRKTLHETNFDGLRGTARQVAAILSQNAALSSSSRENIQSQFESMDKAMKSYCAATAAGKESLLSAFNNASVEWQLLVNGQ